MKTQKINYFIILQSITWVLALVLRLTLLVSGVALFYLGVDSVITPTIYQVHGVGNQIIFCFIMLISMVVGVFVVIKSLTSSNDNLTEFY